MAKLTNEQVRVKMTTWRAEAESGNKPVFRRMTKNSRFKIGRQFDKDVLEYNQSRHRHSIVVNRVLPIVNMLDGEQVRNPRDLTAVAYKGGNATRARLLTALMKQVCDSSHGRHQQSEAFDSGVTTARGYLGIDTSYLADPSGDLQLCTWSPFTILPDPHRRKYDPNDLREGWRYVFIDEWEPKFKVETQYPRKKEDLKHAHYGSSDVSGWLGRAATAVFNYLFPGNEAWDNHDDYRDPNQAEDDEPDTKTKWEDHYRVTTCYWRDWREGVYVKRIDVPDWFAVLYLDRDIKYAKQLMAEAEAGGAQSPVQIIEKSGDGLPVLVPVLMRTKMVGDIVLDHTEDPFDGIWKYPIAPYNAYFEDGTEFAVVDNLIGPQEACNWAWSACLNFVKKMMHTGWKVGEVLPAMKGWLEAHGDEENLIIDLKKFGGTAERDLPAPYPTALDNVSERSTVQMNEIANIRTERPEFDQKNMSGVAIARKQAASDQGSASLFGNWDMTLEIVGDVLIEHITRRRTYTQDEIRQIVDDADLLDGELLAKAKENILVAGKVSPIPPPPPDPASLAQSSPLVQRSMISEYQDHLRIYQETMLEAEKLAPEMAIKMLLDELTEIQDGKTKFGVRSSLGESATTFREANFAQMIALDAMLRQRGEPGVPRDELIKASDVPHKDAILAQKQAAPALPGNVPAMAAA